MPVFVLASFICLRILLYCFKLGSLLKVPRMISITSELSFGTNNLPADGYKSVYRLSARRIVACLEEVGKEAVKIPEKSEVKGLPSISTV